MPQNAHPFVSVIIPVFNDAKRLALCLDALKKQTYPKASFEVIIVDNGSEQSPEAVVKPFSFARYAMETKVGSYAARNKGLALAKGDYLAFTDADCIAHRDWLAHGVAALQKIDCRGLIGGHVHLFVAHHDHPTWVELYDRSLNLSMDQQRFIEQHHFAITANIFTHRRVFDRVGLFDAQLKSGGDMEWSRRVAEAGLTLRYAREAAIDHPARATWKQIIVQKRRVVGGQHVQKTDKAALYRPLRFLRAIWKSVIPQCPAIWRQSRHPQLPRLGQRLKVVWVLLVLQYVTMYERVRVRLGGACERR